MGNVLEALAAAGLDPGGADRPEVRSSLARLARIIRTRGLRSLGLCPAGDEVVIPPLALALGRSLAETGPDPVAVVDAAGDWACASDLLALSDPTETDGAISWIAERLAILTPWPGTAGETLVTLKLALAAGSGRFSALVVDLTGLGPMGASTGAFALLDGTAVVARAGKTTRRRVVQALRDIPEGRNLGVLLTGT
jgi:hypothetical protein